jgi:plastocyanin
MRKLLLVPSAAALIAAVGLAGAATVTVTVKSSGFSPATVTLNYKDAITWKNGDSADHQVVANDGSFASPILKAGQSYTHTFTTAGTFPYHDAIKSSLKGTIHVKGPPPSVTLGAAPSIVAYGSEVLLTGQISTKASGQNVTLSAQPYGQPSPLVLVTVVTGQNGTFAYQTRPAQYTTYVASWSGVSSAPVIVQVAPRVTLRPGRSGLMRTQVVAGRSLWHHHVFLQRLSRFGQWVNVGALQLGPRSGRVFQPAHYLPKGTSRIRVFLSVNQAGVGLLSAHSGMQTVHKS